MVSRIQQSLSFHDSPESFISSRLHQISLSDPNRLPGSSSTSSNPIIRAAILDRNVHIISSYSLCDVILRGDVSSTSIISRDTKTGHEDDEDGLVFAAEPAYKQFMSAFFPGPNILLQDGPRHQMNKKRWKERISLLGSESSGLEAIIRRLTMERFIEPLVQSAQMAGRGTLTIDLYDSTKTLAWDMLFGIFLGLDRNVDEREFRRTEDRQENLLRGQFSLFPVSVRTPFWSSPRTKGLDAVKSLQNFLAERLDEFNLPSAPVCPFMQQSKGDNKETLGGHIFEKDDMVAHLLVFTSSIANKALASLLTALLMNLYLWRDEGGSGAGSLADLIRSQEDEATKVRMLKSILAETERLSPPVVGVMRRVNRGILLQWPLEREDPEPETSVYTIKNGHDAWLYLAGASRDPTVFEDAEVFCWDRYVSAEDGEVGKGFAFGGGVKECLGINLARQICLTAAKTILKSPLVLDGTVPDRGVRHWLGWEKDVPLDVVAKELKQLPCQRPRRPVKVDVMVDR